MTREDLQREQRADLAYFDLVAAKTPEARREAFQRLCAEVKARTPARVAELERDRGLR